jgi:2-polyprenyl-6-methoxyphenol hydroxylase-like FAD-dependent oxidoreductase
MIDVLVVGGGPVGLATAIRCALAGLSVTVAEPRAAPIDKACGEGVMPAAVRRLAALGVTPDGYPLRGIRYLDAGHRADARFRHGDGLGVRRTVLHAALAARAAALGIPVIPARVTTFERHAEHMTAAGVEARYLVAADGLHSSIRRQLEREAPGRATLDRATLNREAPGRATLGREAAAVQRGGAAFGSVRGPRSPVPRYGLRRHFRVTPWTDLVEVHWTPEAEAYVTPVAADVVGIALLFGRPRGGGAAGRDMDGPPAGGRPGNGLHGDEQLGGGQLMDGQFEGQPDMDGPPAGGLHGDGLPGNGPGRAAPLRPGIGRDDARGEAGGDGTRQAAGHGGLRVETDSDGTREAAGRAGIRIAASGDATGVTAGGDFAARLAAFPALRERLGDALPASEVRGAGPMRQNVRRRVYGRVLLVGDASGYVDALTGEGIGVGLAQAEALAACLAADRPADYERAWRRASGPAWRFTAGLLWSRNQSLLGPCIVPAAQHLPWLFTALVNHAAQA